MKAACWLLMIAASAWLPSAAAVPKTWKAGVARVDITPDKPIFLTGYAARMRPAESALTRIWAKALALEDTRRHRVVIVTTDLIGLPGGLANVVTARVAQQYKLDRNSIVLNSSHTHTGPVVGANLNIMFDFTPEQKRAVQEYAVRLIDALVQVTGEALHNLKPAEIGYDEGTAGFAVNRREFTANGGVRIGVNPTGPVDHSVPVLRVRTADGKLLAALVGYACHNTTLTAEFNQVSGDYAGYMQTAFEEAHPGATALFLMLCGGDQNPNPRSTLDLAKQHGKELAAAAGKVVDGSAVQPLSGELRSLFRTVNVAFAPHSRDTFAKMREDKNVYRQRLAQAMLEAYEAGQPKNGIVYPVQVVRLGDKLTLLALGGEVVIDYTLRARKEFAGTKLIVAGYSNDVMCYIPSLRVLKEGGYEAVESMVYYGQPGPFSEDVEETIFGAIRAAMAKVSVR